MVSVLHAGDAHPVAAGGHAAARQLLRVAAAHEAFHQCLVAGIARPALLVLEEERDGPAEEFRIDLVMEANGQVGRDVELVRRLEREIGEAARTVVVVFVRTRQLPVAAVLQEEAREIEHGLVVGQDARADIAFVERIEQILQLAARAAAVVGAAEHREPAAPLHGLAEGGRRLGRQFQVDRAHRAQVFGKLRVAFFLRQRKNLLARAADEGDDVLHHGDLRIVEGVVAFVVLRALVLQLRQNAAPALVEADLEIGREMVAVVDAGDDLIAVEDGLKVGIGVVGVPLRARRTQPFEEEEPLGGEGVQRIDVDRVLVENRAVVLAPRLEAVDGAVGMVGLERVVECILLDEAVVVLVRAAGPRLFGRLLHLARAQERDAFVVGERLVGREFADEMYLAHVIRSLKSWRHVSTL